VLRSTQIPEPEYITELVEGAVYTVPGATVLVLGDPPPALLGDAPLLTGALVLRYGLTVTVPRSDVLIPGLFAAERGGFLVGREAWDFIQSNFALHARADVLGMLPNGKTAQVFMREIDFGVPVRVLVYGSLDALSAQAEVIALFEGNNAPPLPELLPHYLPAVEDIDSLL
jgi:hypothetical protein